MGNISKIKSIQVSDTCAVKVYRLVDTDEYRVVTSVQGRRVGEGEGYYTDSKEDAMGTATYMVGEAQRAGL